MNLFKFVAKIFALIGCIVALLSFANVKDKQNYVIVYDEENAK